ncbi:hypothetical protein ACFYO1_08205 [Nocardia sp. NPDC006044]|uniref:hypothetical protein n=1 Tax=Nocardia sp. NPDC006044 TaxID=3364306 RepID=UPI00367C0CCC
MTLQVDLEKLGALSRTLHDLSGEASQLYAREGVPWSSLPGFDSMALPSVIEASKLTSVVQDNLIPAMSARLDEIGNLMHAATVHFGTMEGANEAALAETYTTASGDWGIPK